MACSVIWIENYLEIGLNFNWTLRLSIVVLYLVNAFWATRYGATNSTIVKAAAGLIAPAHNKQATPMGEHRLWLVSLTSSPSIKTRPVQFVVHSLRIRPVPIFHYQQCDYNCKKLLLSRLSMVSSWLISSQLLINFPCFVIFKSEATKKEETKWNGFMGRFGGSFNGMLIGWKLFRFASGIHELQSGRPDGCYPARNSCGIVNELENGRFVSPRHEPWSLNNLNLVELESRY